MVVEGHRLIWGPFASPRAESVERFPIRLLFKFGGPGGRDVPPPEIAAWGVGAR